MLGYIRVVGGDEYVQEFYGSMKSVMMKIDLLVFVPIEDPDIITCEDLSGLREEVNEVLLSWLDDLNIEIIEAKGTLMNRKKLVLEKINSLK